MKIEMGESLFYSWLRHIKGCQLVQTNWKASPNWVLHNEDQLTEIMEKASVVFINVFGLDIIGKTRKLSQFLRQAECDALGITTGSGINKITAVDVAFHRDGLLYGSTRETVEKVIEKCIRNAMCIYGYLGSNDADIFFAAPKISDRIMQLLEPSIEELQRITDEMGFSFHFQVIANNAFNQMVLKPVLDLSHNVADTTELFLRSYQMTTMFQGKET